MQEKRLQKDMKAKKPASKADILPSENPKLFATGQERLNDRLLYEAYSNDLKEIRQLIKAGADVKTKDSDGRTALHYAAENCNVRLCILLLVECAKSGGDAANFLVPHDIGVRTPLRMARATEIAQNIEIVHFFESMENLSKSMDNEMFSSFMKSFGECIAAA